MDYRKVGNHIQRIKERSVEIGTKTLTEGCKSKAGEEQEIHMTEENAEEKEMTEEAQFGKGELICSISLPIRMEQLARIWSVIAENIDDKASVELRTETMRGKKALSLYVVS